jgi:hypothetical protein
MALGPYPPECPIFNDGGEIVVHLQGVSATGGNRWYLKKKIAASAD